MKFKNLLLAAILVILAPVCFVACGEQQTNNYVGVGWVEVAEDNNIIAMALDSEQNTFAIDYNVMPSTATNKEVNFESSDRNVATVDEDGVITAVGVGTASITIQSRDNQNAFVRITVNVLAEKQQLATPTGLNYNPATKTLSWNRVIVENSSFVPQYRLNFNIDGVESTQIVSNTTFSDIVEGSLYNVSVTALGNETMYNDSESSDTVTFAQLAAPTEIELVGTRGENDANRSYQLKFKLSNFAPTIENYDIDINVTNGVYTEEDRALWENAIATAHVDEGYVYIDVPEELGRSTFSFRVRATNTEDERYVTSDYSEAIKFARLSSPENLTLAYIGDTQQLTWSTVLNANAYRILIEYTMNDGTKENRFVNISASSETPTMYDFSNLTDKPADNTYTGFDVYVFAIAADYNIAGVRYLDSDINDIPALQQLPSVENITVSKDDENSQYVLTWSEVGRASSYQVYISTNQNATIYSTDKLVYAGTRTSCTIAFRQQYEQAESVWSVGRNYIKIVALPGESTQYIASTPSVNNESFIKLATPTNFKVSSGKLVWDAVDGATYYEIDFGAGATDKPRVTSIPGKSTYEYEPTSTDMPQTSTNYYISVRAVNGDNNLYIDSDETDVINVSRYATPTELRVEDGELQWDMTDSLGNNINTDRVEVRIETLQGDVLTTFETGSSVTVEEQLANLPTTDHYFVFKVRAINVYENRNYVNGDWSTGISTYQLATPSNVRIENGVITWDAFADGNVASGHTGIRYVLKVGSQEYGETSNPILTIGSTSAVITGLSAGATTYSVQLKTTILASESGDFGTTILGNDTIYIINSNFSQTFYVRQLPTPSSVTIRDSTLYWSTSNSDLNQYRIELYRIDVNDGIRTRGDLVYTTLVEPADKNNPSWNFSTEKWFIGEDDAEFDFTYGAYEFVIYAVGTTHNAESTANYGYLTSYASSSIEIYKLQTPSLNIDNGIVSWNYVYDNLGGTPRMVSKYILSVSRNTGNNVMDTFDIVVESGFTSALDDLPERFYNVQLFISIKAVSVWDRVYDSELSAPYTRPTNALPESGTYIVQKQFYPQVDPSHVSIEGRTITWTDTNVDNKSYIVQVYEVSPTRGEILIATATVTENEYTLPDRGSGEYYIRILRKGYTYDNPSDPETPVAEKLAGTKYLDSKYSDKLYIERLVKPIGVTMTRDDNENPILSWSAEGAADYMKYRINITTVENGETVVDSYYLPYTTTSFNLFGKAYNDEGVEIDVKSYTAGILRITVQTVIADSDGVIARATSQTSPNTVYLMEGPVSTTYTAYVYAAPTVTFDDGILYFNKTNQFDKGLELVFTPLVSGSAGTYTLNTEGAIHKSLNSGIDTFDMSEGFETGVKYQLRLRALGNSNSLISSEWENCIYILERLAPFNANSVNSGIENESTYNGWYVKDGSIYWNAVTGVSVYEATLTSAAGAVFNAFTIEADSATKQYSSPIVGINYGTYDLRFKLIGGATNTEITIQDDDATYLMGYVTSDLSTAQPVTKLYAPNNYNVDGRSEAYSRIVNGEFDWGLRDEDGVWIDNSGATAYRLEVADNESYTFTLDGTAKYFYASEVFKELSGRYEITLYSIGNTWTGTNDSGSIYLTSDAYSSFTIIYGGQIGDLNVTNGRLNWSAASNGSRSGYDIEYIYSGEEASPLKHLDTNVYSFDDIEEAKGKNFNSIKVRYAGESSTVKGAYEGYTNCMWSASMTNIVKLPDIALTPMSSGESRYLYINDWGQLEWNLGSNYTEGQFADLDLDMHLYLDITYLGTSVGGNSTGWNVDRSINVFDVPTINISQEDINNALQQAGNTHSEQGILKYNMYGYIAGTVDTETDITDGNNVIYLNSNTYDCGAYMLNAPTSFELDQVNGPGLRLNWDISNSSVGGYEPEESRYIEVAADVIMFTYRVNGSNELVHKRVTSVEEISQIPLWEVAYFDEIRMNVLNSDGIAFGSSTLSLEKIAFQYFDSGNGTPESPFVIKDVTGYSAEYQLELVYWLPELYFKLGQDITLTDLDILKQENVSTTTNFPIPAGLTASAVDQVYKNLTFTGGFDGAGFSIKNIQVSGATSFGWWNRVLGSELSEAGENNFENRRGIIKDLTLVADRIDVSTLAAGSYNGLFTQRNYGWIIDCTVDGSTIGDRDEGVYTPVIQGTVNNTNIYIGGFVGANGSYDGGPNDEGLYDDFEGAGRIDGCTNMLDLVIESTNSLNYITYVGGIAGTNSSGTIIGSNNGIANMDTSYNNRAEISGYYTGGIAGASVGSTTMLGDDEEVYVYSYISGCINYADVSTRNESFGGSSIEASTAGGIVGMARIAFTTYCMNMGTVFTDGVSAALGGIVGAQETGGNTLSCVNIGDVRYNQYYYDPAQIDVTSYMSAGAIVGMSTSSNIISIWYVQGSVVKYDNITNTPTRITVVNGGGSATTSMINSVESFDKNNYVDAFLNGAEKINQVSVQANTQLVDCIYERYDGLVAQFAYTAGSNPTITWVDPSILR